MKLCLVGKQVVNPLANRQGSGWRWTRGWASRAHR